ncbi:hypothetical protein NQ314_012650 [Rhamnusium bicolor]|uniref:MADF domain-containing protein n=1 Tax=Rhamnusium bicolor TaxID=1586634 RepID=A0AAV8XAJ0_9CUCU|nr:hypothetical protein NQ314_012650 [Rhamnusium bicolor]
MWSYSYFPDHFNSVDLIRLVEKHPVLWNPYHADHNNKQQRNKAWERIAQKIVINWVNLPDAEKYGTAGEIRNKWKNIKDTFTKDQRIRSKNQSTRKKRKYIYTDILQFLNVQGCVQNFPEETEDDEVEQNVVLEDDEPTLEDEVDLTDKKICIKIDPGDPNDEKVELDVPSKIKFVDMCSFNNELATSSDCDSGSENSVLPPKRAHFDKNRRSEQYQTEQNNEPSSSSFVSSSSSGKKRTFAEITHAEGSEVADDPDRMFLLSMLPLFKKLSEVEKLSARIQLTQVLQKLLYPKK